ncbi:hypothetical protein HPB49_010771 [Dermacentor silvarum]|uniref:Uncharacterized protein n=1 Tax=Dermacentor silvarum TaxID=543639 RepID=A0ACB8C8W4_DERSI|nr:hypothetical protein HPB49_010771 [Dermacentor silvarum]
MTSLAPDKEPQPVVDGVVSDVTKVRKDGGVAWLVCLASFWVHGAVFGIINCFGVLYPVIHDLAPDKEQASFHASLVGSLCVGSTFAMSPVASLLADKFGARITVVCGGIIGSVGLLLSSWAFRVMSVLTLSVALCGIAFKTPVVIHGWNDEDKEPSGCCDVLNRSIWKNRRFVVWVIAIPLALFGYFVPYVHLVQHVDDVFPDANGETLVTCMGITSGLGRVLFGRLADLPSVSPVVLQQVSFMAMGLLTLSIAAAHTYVSLVLVCLLLGLCDGCFISLIGPAAQRLTGTRGASQAIGFLLGLCSVPLTAGPPAAGILYDQRGNYNLAFLLAGVPPIVASILMCAIHLIKTDPDEQHDVRPKESDILGTRRLSALVASEP